MQQTRRTVLASLGSAATAGLAGCASVLGSPNDGESQTYLSEQEFSVDPDAIPYPTYGDRLPEATLGAPLRDAGELTVPDDFAGTDVLMTFVYTTCMTMCPRLTAILAYVQGHSLSNGYGDRMSFVEMTFDPERDDAQKLRSWVDSHNVDMDAGNWYMLRPDSQERAKAVVGDTYGVAFERTQPEDMDRYMYAHQGIILLANKQGYVERTYKLWGGAAANSENAIRWTDVRDDLATLREREP